MRLFNGRLDDLDRNRDGRDSGLRLFHHRGVLFFRLKGRRFRFRTGNAAPLDFLNELVYLFLNALLFRRITGLLIYLQFHDRVLELPVLLIGIGKHVMGLSPPGIIGKRLFQIIDHQSRLVLQFAQFGEIKIGVVVVRIFGEHGVEFRPPSVASFCI